MDTLEAFARGCAARGEERMVFDWLRAAELIHEHKSERASAGLRDDWEHTGGEILAGGQPVRDSYTYLASTWAEPEIVLDGRIRRPCYRMETDARGWTERTKWPEEAVSLLARLRNGE